MGCALIALLVAGASGAFVVALWRDESREGRRRRHRFASTGILALAVALMVFFGSDARVLWAWIIVGALSLVALVIIAVGERG
jgi:hypothetical protein